MYKNERAAYLVDKFLGFNLVPPTTIRSIDGEIGSLQQFIPDAQEITVLSGAYAKTKMENEERKKELIKLWIFDYIIWNKDRHGGNVLIKDKKVYAIDNGLAFSTSSLGYWQSYEYFFNQPVPDEVIGALEKFYPIESEGPVNEAVEAVWRENERVLRDLLLELLSEQDVSACLGRMRLIRIFLRRYKGIIPLEVKEKLTF